ncbi:M14 family metallopeptidase [Salimicrobium halophilum]|uniref:Gamma-D-glutamyl-(L)-meso-diaminopimelate peptidase I Metallo peptidase. MEROPS family M14C n=1 Tax=Salimicrobium halophilum TaxID=86666 RepID=A0A1G8WUP1_9BACI|nr:M14 family metallopeptidase [Salimicrobium halophilum]SDJ81345.1 gamma-D-glutamyl-{L}-meso-diaminopimelate peptidase I Metallo peptidase. MEROPS family M14C [Salimicrobium halophilum]
MDIKIRQGDNLWYLSQLLNVPLYLILASNPGVAPEALSPGDTIHVPGYRLVPYTIQPGDNLYSITTKRGLGLDTILLANPDIDPYNLQVSDVLSIPERLTGPLFLTNQPYDYDILTGHIDKLLAAYPFIRKNIIGRSIEGKEIVEVVLGEGNKNIHWNGAFHANEWITTPVLMKFLNDYALALTNNETIRGLTMAPFFQNVRLSVVPMVNPDGVDLVINGASASNNPEEVLRINGGSEDFSGWKANIRGVDLNNQYPANWEIEQARKPDTPAPRDFPGYAPLTEPEAIALAEISPAMQSALAFHTQGEVIFWGYEGLEPPASEVMVEEFARVSGYQPIRYVDSYAGYKDWFIQDFRRPGFTVELGRGVNPLPLSQFDEIYQRTLGILLASLYMA